MFLNLFSCLFTEIIKIGFVSYAVNIPGWMLNPSRRHLMFQEVKQCIVTWNRDFGTQAKIDGNMRSLGISRVDKFVTSPVVARLLKMER
jgi:hypothetical protein